MLSPGDLDRAAAGFVHVTAHAIDDVHAFGDFEDKSLFLEKFRNFLSPEPRRDRSRRLYPKYVDLASLVAFCVLDNHYHAIVRQLCPGGARRLMDSVLSAYGRDFNKKYGRRGSIWREPYGARWIANQSQGVRTLAYVTLNHENKRERYAFSSHDYYVGARNADWIDVESGLAWFHGDRSRYERFIKNEGYAAVDRKIAERDGRPAPHRRTLKRGPGTHIATRSAGQG